VIKHQRLHREPDPKVRRSFAAALAISAVLVVGALLVVGLRVQQVQLAYRLDALRAERTRTETLIRQLDPVYFDFTQSSTEVLRLKRTLENGPGRMDRDR